MEMLNKASETVLQYLIELSRGCENVDLRVVRNAFADDPSVQTDTVLTNLQNAGMLNLHTNDAMTIGKITLTCDGKLYFTNKEELRTPKEPTPTQQIFNITNSSNFTAGNYSKFISSESISFDDVRRLISDLQLEHQQELQEVIDALQDSIENSKPLPQGKFKKFLLNVEKAVPVLLGIGKLVVQAVQK